MSGKILLRMVSTPSIFPKFNFSSVVMELQVLFLPLVFLILKVTQLNLKKPYSYYLGQLPGSISAILLSSEFLASMGYAERNRTKQKKKKLLIPTSAGNSYGSQSSNISSWISFGIGSSLLCTSFFSVLCFLFSCWFLSSFYSPNVLGMCLFFWLGTLNLIFYLPFRK